MHADVCRLSLHSRCLHPALDLIQDSDVLEVAYEAAQADSKHVLLYFYYGGMLLTIVKARIYSLK